ncbi:hypothetical protein [Paenibacillus glycanilyticus]|uniref:Uncharacterized protein n=1 Tax=Paenibacillus glycanilyticus TaxID=126569 RepID=A0ABQ6NQQ0_9BACL|nr:hypothetical protein [Paenibacillus glycanilyticus]GMK47390.1 hypothetical protein PghCCS26_45200 [Paenibacillus glycanilyticus]
MGRTGSGRRKLFFPIRLKFVILLCGLITAPFLISGIMTYLHICGAFLQGITPQEAGIPELQARLRERGAILD